MTEAAESSDGQGDSGYDEILIRDTQGMSNSFLLSCLFPFSAVFAADVRPCAKVVRMDMPAAGPHTASGHVVTSSQAGTVRKSGAAGSQQHACLRTSEPTLLFACSLLVGYIVPDEAAGL